MNDDPDLFYNKVKLGFLGFRMGKSENVQFSIGFVLCDMEMYLT